MKKIYLALFYCIFIFNCYAQVQRVAITSIVPSENVGQDYSPWLNDNTDSLVADAWQANMKYIDVTLQLASKTLVSKLTFFDGAGVFTTNPAYIYALKGNERIYLGKFEGTTYLTYVDLVLQNPILADAIIIHKYSNNIPQKVQIFGQPYIDSATTPEPSNRLYFASAIPSENTGQNYNQWLNDNLDSTIDWGNQNSFKYIDVTLKLQQRSKIKKFSFWDTEGEFSSDPCYFYAVKDTTKTFLGTFTGPGYNTWIDLVLPEAVTADAILVHKYSRYIPQKINAYGEPLLTDPLDTIVPFDGRIKITSVTASENTGQDYSPLLNDNMDSLVQGNWTAANYVYTDVKLTLEKKSKIGRLSLYNTNVFYDHTALIYAQNDTTKTLIGEFIGNRYNDFIGMTPTDSLIADAIIIHKYSNNLPNKIKIYGTTYVPPTAVIPVDSATIVKIPIDPKRWFQLNNVTDAIKPMFDGDTNTTIYAGYGKIIPNYDAYYPVNKNEHIDITSIKFYDGQGALGDYPVTVSVINDQGQKTQVGVFNGSLYNTWVGAYPDRQTNNTNFNLDSILKNVKYLVLNCWYSYPNEIQFYGHYQAGDTVATAPIAKNIRFKDATGINAFEWDFLNAYNPMVIDESKFTAIKNFTGVRHYIDWEKLEGTEGKYTFSPVHSGGWNYDTIYQRCKAEGIEVLACIKTIPLWMQQGYPESEREWESVPVRYGSDFADPNSYLEQSKLAFQYAGRYGHNKNVNSSLMSVDGSQRWTGDDVNTVKIGMGLINYMECDNERDKWWKGRKGYQTPFEYAANLSAFYDGNMNTMGAGVGIKNADTSMKVVMAGLAAADPAYVHGMIEWCRIHRGYRADSSVNICWDVINYHLYSNDSKQSQYGIATRGVAPELSEAAQTAKDFVQMAHEYANDMPVWITETGYDANQGSPYKAIPIGNKDEFATQADWILRTSLMYVRLGIDKVFFYQLYDDNFLNPTQFGSSGLINQDRTRKPAADFIYQTNKLIGDYSFKETLNADPVVDRYELNGQSAYALSIPDEIGRTALYNLDLGSSVDSAKIYSPLIGSDTMSVKYVKTNGGTLEITVTETPLFVVPIKTAPRTNSIVRNSTTENIEQAMAIPMAVFAGKLNVFPNPSSNIITISVAGDKDNATEIKVVATATGISHMQLTAAKGSGAVVKQINMGNLPAGTYIIYIKQGTNSQYKTILKTSN